MTSADSDVARSMTATSEPPAFLAHKNPVWVRELRQSARLTRTPFVLALVTALTALVICSVGGLASTTAAPAEVGVVTFHTFFSLAFAVTTWVGPGVAAMTIASERSGRTWEALLLTGLAPRVIARGKFLAALTYIGLYLVMLAPVGALPFLFGGVTATEVAAAFVLLALFASLAIGFGLSISSALSSPGLAAVVTLPIAFAVSLTAYTTFGIGGSFVAHELWPVVTQGAPVWLPTAYVRASFGPEYFVYLVLVPIGTILLAAWFFYETTVANMMDPSDDRSSGLKRWFLVALPSFTAMALCPAALASSDRALYGAGGVGFLFGVGVVCLFLFAGDALEPSPRVVTAWERKRAGTAARFLGPGIVNTVTLVLMITIGAVVAVTVASAALDRASGAPHSSARVGSLLVVACYASAFLVFLSGLSVFSRARAASGTTPRLMLLFATFVAFVVPWLALAISGVFGSSVEARLPIAAPSPAFALAMATELNRFLGPPRRDVIAAGSACMLFWALGGLVLFSIGTRRVREQTEARRRAREELLEHIRAEEAQSSASVTAGAPKA